MKDPGNEVAFRAEKRNKHAGDLAARQSPKLKKKWREFRRSCKQKKLRTSLAFAIFPVGSNILTSLKESWCIVPVENQSLFGHAEKNSCLPRYK